MKGNRPNSFPPANPRVFEAGEVQGSFLPLPGKHELNYSVKVPVSQMVGSLFLLAGVVSTKALFSRALRERLSRLNPGGGGNGECLTWKSQEPRDGLPRVWILLLTDATGLDGEF